MTVQLIFPKHYDSVTTHEANRDRVKEAYYKYEQGFMSYPIDRDTTVDKIREAVAKHFTVAFDHIRLRIHTLGDRTRVLDFPPLKDSDNVIDELKKEDATKISVEIAKCRDRVHCPKTISVSVDFNLCYNSQYIYVTLKPGMNRKDLQKIVEDRIGFRPDFISLYSDNLDLLQEGQQLNVERPCCPIL